MAENPASTTSAASMNLLAPSQTIRSQSSGNLSKKNEKPTASSTNNTIRAGDADSAQPSVSASSEASPPFDTVAASPSRNKKQKNRGQRGRKKDGNLNPPSEANPTTDAASDEVASSKPAPTQRMPKKKKQAKDDSQPSLQAKMSSQPKPPPAESSVPEANQKQPSKKKKKKRNRHRKRFAWRAHIPPESVDPITLENLDTLKYPPFALVATEPYTPVPEWPIPTYQAAESQAVVDEETEEERQRRILAEQWGEKLPSEDPKPASDTTEALVVDPAKRHYHLYDGRALAYYMVSQLQFIDPLNRRDLVRDELLNLDHYLRRHGFTDLNVTEAYDAKGVTISTAGATATTAAGHAAMLQQLAGNLLQGLFGGHSVSSSRRQSRPTNALMRQYQQHEQAQQQQQSQYRQTQEEDIGIYGDSAGLMIIDDDLHPGLRGSAPVFVPSEANAAAPNTLWSASQITARYGHQAAVQESNFPSLSATTPSTEISQPPPLEQEPASKKPVSKTLARIGQTVKKTDPEETQRQWEAREQARRKAMMSNLTFGSNLAAWDTATSSEIPTTITTTSDATGPTEAQIERNRAFAQALGVTPATVRTASLTGWARPSEGEVDLDEFGNELGATVYPDALISQARECMTALLRLEKKWKNFLTDDKAASLPLNAMDRPMRTFVHEYSDYWKLHTESFDPEPKRYIHCVKLRDTSAPYPLLSDAARNWRGPRPLIQSSAMLSDHAMQQTAGQQTTQAARDLPVAPQRVPLPLKPRSTAGATTTSTSGMTIGGAPTRTMTESSDPTTLSSRFGDLVVRERPKLDLQKRTIPLELPPFEQPEKGFDISEELRLQKERAEAKARKKREEEERKKEALEAAFASSDEEGGGGESDSEWEDAEQEPAYTGSDDEE